jgi:hypothetical protein
VHGQSSIIVDVVSAIESGLPCRAAAVQFGASASRRYIGGLSRGGRARARPGIKVATSRRTGSRPMPSGSFHSRRRSPTFPGCGIFLAYVEHAPVPNCGRPTFGTYQRLRSPKRMHDRHLPM